MFDVFVILFFVILFVGLVFWFVFVGIFDIKNIIILDGNIKIVFDVDSFKYVEESYGFVLFDGIGNKMGIVNYVFDGMVLGDKWGVVVGVIVFIFIVGGVFGIVM